MIVVYVNTMEDTATFSRLYDGLDCTLLYNPTREEVETALANNPTETLMCLGHGSSRGLFASDMRGFLIDSKMLDLLVTREIIGIWCYASDFARYNNLRGFFTYMFISNSNECLWNRCGEYSNDIIFEQNRKFATNINNLIIDGTPIEDWVELLYNDCDIDLPFVEFNYSNLAYFDGTETYVPQHIIDEQNEPTLFEQDDDFFFGEYGLTDEDIQNYIAMRDAWEEQQKDEKNDNLPF